MHSIGNPKPWRILALGLILVMLVAMACAPAEAPQPVVIEKEVVREVVKEVPVVTEVVKEAEVIREVLVEAEVVVHTSRKLIMVPQICRKTTLWTLLLVQVVRVVRWTTKDRLVNPLGCIHIQEVQLQP